ncbi:Fusaric acid resistance protein-like-domain-containing protein [Microdochium trichocladiopsis]|uniref:Fusaric acid resistance protein-like-domain-containing protein n=1 Tax=Microdochium trichocladiopsis TaxID=1682393 RepID=A0A9P9BQS6_9PEZI|nr:Fusaric acid resistance protein-like-domain-containing protein [Microdochium trichocladiopsis]KAH7026187.1 Fusaric acid resistance protein-like-domain-containing protein [Microdochium trichocladiopsis]
MSRPRQKLRNGTWIIPGTGQRSRRQFTLRHPDLDGSNDDEDAQPRPLSEGESFSDKFSNVSHNVRLAARNTWLWAQSPKGRGTIKCSIAYLIASMGTFWHPAASWLGHLDGKHIVATISVYFHPARTAGSQMEAVAIAVVAVCYSMLIGILSMATSVLVGSVWDQTALSYVIILLVFIGGGLGFVGWVKQKLNSPLVSVGASIASIGIITIVTKENSVHSGVFANQKIIQSLRILFMATTISTLVNLLLFPVSARYGLRATMRKASTSLHDMLTMISHGFIYGSEEEFNTKAFSDALAAYNSNLTLMNKNAREAKYEYYLLGQEQIYKHDRAVVKAMESLAQSIGGLRSAADTQFELLKEVAQGSTVNSLAVGGAMTPRGTSFSLSSSPQSVAYFGSPKFGNLSAISEATEERSDRGSGLSTPGQTFSPANISTPGVQTFRTPADIFELFIARLGPSMKSLSYTMAEILKEPPFGEPGHPIAAQDQFKDSLADAISLFNEARANALEELYRTVEFGRQRPENVQADFEEVAAACGHFSFTLVSFGDEMLRYLDAVDDLKFVSSQPRRTWKWLMFWKNIDFAYKAKTTPNDPEAANLVETVKKLRQSKLPSGIPASMTKRRDNFAWQAESKEESFYDKVVRVCSQRTLKIFRFLSRDDIRFGVKVGLGATIYAMFAFIPDTRPIYAHWRGEWGLLSFMIVCSMTVGASNATGFARFIGTLIGAIFVIINWWISDGEAVLLAFLGWLVSLGAFYIMVDRGNGPFGRFILLSYNVSSLYAYSLSQKVDDDDDDEGGVNPIITEIAYHRVVAVSIGILWGLIVCRVFWPMPARRKFKEGLAVLYLQMGLIWKRGPLSVLLHEENHPKSYMKTGEQAAMQRYATQLQTLRVAAKSEYGLRGPFPFETYGRIMSSTQRLLDAFHAMSLVSEKHGKLRPGERALLYGTSAERIELCARICHVFQVLASSIMLEYPLTDAIPSVVSMRDKLLGKIFRFRKEHNATLLNANLGGVVNADDVAAEGASAPSDDAMADVQAEAVPERVKESTMLGAVGSVPDVGDVNLEESDYALLYAYALVTSHVAKELRVVEKEIENLFGRLDDQTVLLQ